MWTNILIKLDVEKERGFTLVKITISWIYHRNLLIAATKTQHKTTEKYPSLKTNGRRVSYVVNSGYENVVSGVVPGISFNDTYLSHLYKKIKWNIRLLVTLCRSVRPKLHNIFREYMTLKEGGGERWRSCNKRCWPNIMFFSSTAQKTASRDHELRHSFIHLAVCLTTGPKPLPKPALYIVRSRASSFRCEYPLLSLRSSSSFLRLLPRLHRLPRLPLTSIHPFIFPPITWN
jgi:hypothetical protein